MLPVEQYMLGINTGALRALRLDSDVLLEHLWKVAVRLPVEQGDATETIQQCDQLNDLLGATFYHRATLLPYRGIASLADFAPYKRLFMAEDFFGLLDAELEGGATYETLLHCPLNRLSKAHFDLLSGLCEAKFLLPAQILGLIAIYWATDELRALPHRPELRLVVDNPAAKRQAGLAQLSAI